MECFKSVGNDDDPIGHHAESLSYFEVGDGVAEDLHIFGFGTGEDAVAEVEDVAVAATHGLEESGGFCADDIF